MTLLYLCLTCLIYFFIFFFFNDTATTEIYTLSLHDALPISNPWPVPVHHRWFTGPSSYINFEIASTRLYTKSCNIRPECRSEEHTSELQSQSNLVCRLLLEKKKKKKYKQ